MNEFPLLFPDWRTHDKKPVMVGVSDDCRMACLRDITAEEANELAANWSAYLAQRAEWLAWARVNLKPGPCVIMGKTFPNYQPSAFDIAWLLDYQTL